MITAAIRTPHETTEKPKQVSLSMEQATSFQTIGEQTLGFPVEAVETAVSEPVAVGRSRTGTGIFSKVTQCFWRIAWEFEPLAFGFSPPSTVEFGRSRILSSKDKSELKVYLNKR